MEDTDAFRYKINLLKNW